MARFNHIRVARATVFTFSAMGVLWGAYMALVPDIQAMLGVGDAGFGTLILAAPIAAMVMMTLTPRLAPMFGAHVLPVAVLALGCAFTLPGWLPGPLFFAAAMMLVGGTNGFLDVTMQARVSALEADEGLHLMNLNHAAYSFAYAASAVATGWARHQGWAPWQVLLVASGLVIALSPLAIERGQGINGFARGEGGRGVRLGMVPFWGGLIVMIAFMAENASEAWSALHIERSLGGSKVAGSFGPAVLALTMGVGRTIGQIVVARVSQGRLICWGAVIAGLGTAMVGLAPNASVAYVGLVLAGLGGSVLAPTTFAIIGRLTPRERRAHVIARTTTLGYFGYFIGPPALGFLSEVLGLKWALVAMAGVLVLPLALYPVLVSAGNRRDET